MQVNPVTETDQCFLEGQRMAEGWTAGVTGQLLGLMEMFCILIAVLSSWVYASVQMHRVIQFT